MAAGPTRTPRTQRASSRNASSAASSRTAAPPRILAVRASAGAGKTYQLTLRFLELLKGMSPHKGMSPNPQALRQIVAITFTNRAAAEMKDRVILALKEIALKTDKGESLAAETGLAPAEAAAWLQTILNHFGDFQVRTIDSLIHAVMRAFAVEMGLPPELDVDFDKEAMLDRCFDTLLASIAWDNPRDRNRGLILALIDAYLYIEEAPGMSVEGKIRKRIRKLYDRACEAEGEPADPDHAGTLERLNAASRALLSAMEACGFTACFPGNQRIGDYLGSPRENLDKAFWEKSSLREVSKKAAEFREKDLEKLDRLFAHLKTARREYLYSHARARIYPYLLALAELRKEVRAQPENEGVLLGGTWLERAQECLRGDDESGRYAFLKIGSAVRHFLIDEFQDTSRAQWKMLTELIEECLATGGTLFYVGDVKQAIYGWRGGDWQLFGTVLRDDFPSVELARRAERVLDTNYRSLPAIVEFNNSLYSALLDPVLGRSLAQYMMPKDTPAETCEKLAATLAANFKDVVQKVRPATTAGGAAAGGAAAGGARVGASKAAAGASKAAAGGASPDEGLVCVVSLAGSAEELNADIESWLRRQVKDVWQRREASQHAEQGIAVLVRSNEQAETVATWLVAEGIPIVTENSLRLRSSPLIKGLVSFLHFLEYPLDDMAFWGAAASPLFAGVSADTGADLDAFLRTGRSPRPLYRAFERAFPEASRRLIRPLISRGGFLAPYDLVREVLDLFDVERRFPGEAVFTNRFLEIVFQAEARRSMSLSGFLQFWDETGAEEQVGLPDDLRAVRILTIHKAKGLEFPVVFVPFTNWKRRPDEEAFTEDGNLVWLKSSGGVPLPAELMERRLETTMDDVIENLNTLYVATTRPREELYLYVTCVTRRETPDRQYLAAWLEQMIGAARLDSAVERPAEARQSPKTRRRGSK
jgi:ATP-dependent helicase/nuclease subunit A